MEWHNGFEHCRIEQRQQNPDMNHEILIASGSGILIIIAYEIFPEYNRVRFHPLQRP